jgi:isopenicillin-N N-acyltransferase-like protein
MVAQIDVSGSPYERGLRYGQAAAPLVHRSIAAYAHVYQREAGWDWDRSCREARRYLPAIKDFAPSQVDELFGIADGASVARDDILAINARTEILYAARVRSAGSIDGPEECTAIAALQPDGRVVVGQNWDWAPFAHETIVALRADPDAGPAYLTVVEAGLLAKFGVNSEGLAVMTNALACSEDTGREGVPYHVMLRALLACSDTSAATSVLRSATRASSANYLLVDRSGDIADIEGRPGDAAALHEIRPEDGSLVHTNHFVAPDFTAVDYTDMVESTTRIRLGCATGSLKDLRSSSPEAALEDFIPTLTDHTERPSSVCRHPDPELHEDDQSVTVAAMLVDLTERRVLVAAGPPCEHTFETADFPARTAG